MRDKFTASLVKYERRYGSDKAELAKKRLLLFNEEAAQVKRWVLSRRIQRDFDTVYTLMSRVKQRLFGFA